MLLFDIETNGLLNELDRVWTMTIYDGEKFTRYDRSDVVQGLVRLEQADAIAGHNVIGFDIPAIQKVFPQWKPRGDIIDTLVWARLVFPDIKSTDYGRFNSGRLPGKMIGSHSLEAWGYRLGVLKGEYGKEANAWDQWTPALSEYCEQDVKVTKALVNLLEKRPQMPEALQLEHDVAWIIARQERRGFLFDKALAEELYPQWVGIREGFAERLRTVFPPWYISNGVFVPKKDNRKMHYKAGIPMTRIKLVEFNPASNRHIAKVLGDLYGWQPTSFTEKSGEPEITEEILRAMKYPEAPLIADYWVINKRISQLAEGDKAWLRYIGRDGRIHGAVNSCGAVTGRMTHFAPNMAQVPAGYSPYGEECRSLFMASPGYVMVGADADGLEARCQGHFLAPFDGGAFIRIILEGKKEDGTDLHSTNSKILDSDRDTAKTWYYAWMYGAGVGKLAAILGCSEKKARQKQEDYYNKMPSMRELKAAIEKTVQARGFLRGLDGRHLPIRSAHSALNTLLQSAGAVVMKKALVILDSRLSGSYTPGTDYEFVANVHDEWQIEAVPEIAEVVGKTACEAITEAGEHFKFRCPLSGSFKVGKTWAETH